MENICCTSKMLVQATHGRGRVLGREGREGGAGGQLPSFLYALLDAQAAVDLPPPDRMRGVHLNNRELDKLVNNLGRSPVTWRRSLLLHTWLQVIPGAEGGHKRVDSTPHTPSPKTLAHTCLPPTRARGICACASGDSIGALRASDFAKALLRLLHTRGVRGLIMFCTLCYTTVCLKPGPVR